MTLTVRHNVADGTDDIVDDQPIRQVCFVSLSGFFRKPYCTTCRRRRKPCKFPESSKWACSFCGGYDLYGTPRPVPPPVVCGWWVPK